MKRKDFIKNSSMLAFGISVNKNNFNIDSNDNLDKWQPDGLGFLGKIGILMPSIDPVPESEIKAMAPHGISIHSSRAKYIRNNPASFAESSTIDNAIALLSDVNPRAILYGFTSSSYVLGIQGDQQLIERLQVISNGIPVILPCNAAMEAFRQFNAQKIVLIHPPWFSDEVNAKGRAYFESQGLDVVFCNKLTPARNFSEVAPEELYKWVKKNAAGKGDIIFIGGNGLRTVGAISRLEAALKKPVLTANQVLLWAALRLIGITSKVKNYGRIFTKS